RAPADNRPHHDNRPGPTALRHPPRTDQRTHLPTCLSSKEGDMMFAHHGKPTRAGLAAVFLALALFGAGPASAQQFDSNLPLPRLNTVFPSGAKAGTSVDVTFTGTDLDEPDHLVFSHPGIKAEAIEGKPTAQPPPPDP